MCISMYPPERLVTHLKQNQTVNVSHISPGSCKPPLNVVQSPPPPPSKPHAVHGLQGNVGHASRFKSNLLASKLLHLPEYHLVMSPPCNVSLIRTSIIIIRKLRICQKYKRCLWNILCPIEREKIKLNEIYLFLWKIAHLWWKKI